MIEKAKQLHFRRGNAVRVVVVRFNQFGGFPEHAINWLAAKRRDVVQRGPDLVQRLDLGGKIERGYALD
jgi:hypothetical protein